MRFRGGIACALALACTGCGALGAVEPWEKGYLARREMTFADDRLRRAYADHIYFSKESASGGNGVGGGGCGCN